MVILTRKAQIALKLESVENTAETLTAADATTRVIEPLWTPDISSNKRDVAKASLSKLANVRGTQMASISFKVELKGSGAAGTAPTFGDMLQACGLGETIVASTSVTYEPVSTGVPSATVAMYQDGVRHQIRGARGTFSLVHRVGEVVMIEFEFTGTYDGTTDAALLAPTYDTVIPNSWLSADLDLAGLAEPKTGDLTLTIGNVLTGREDSNTAEGWCGVVITDRDPLGSVQPEMTLVATHDWVGRLVADTLGQLDYTLGAVAGNIVDVICPKVQYVGFAMGDKGGISAPTISLELKEDSGDDEISIAFT